MRTSRNPDRLRSSGQAPTAMPSLPKPRASTFSIRTKARRLPPGRVLRTSTPLPWLPRRSWPVTTRSRTTTPPALTRRTPVPFPARTVARPLPNDPTVTGLSAVGEPVTWSSRLPSNASPPRNRSLSPGRSACRPARAMVFQARSGVVPSWASSPAALTKKSAARTGGLVAKTRAARTRQRGRARNRMGVRTANEVQHRHGGWPRARKAPVLSAGIYLRAACATRQAQRLSWQPRTGPPQDPAVPRRLPAACGTGGCPTWPITRMMCESLA
jgi:hypothetical protein